MTASKVLRDKLSAGSILQIMAAHSPLSARLVEEAGFDGIWASGFELSALFGLPDVSLITMTQHLEMVRAMVEQSSMPVVADLDTGFGNAVNVIYAIEQYERAGAAAVVIEVKTFPKVTSLVADGRQELVRIEEFQGKIAAACAVRKNRDFLIIGRTEALVAALGQTEALNCAEAYAAAGADMILVHSKQGTPDEIESFVHAWNGRVPLVIVPTAYPEMTLERVTNLRKIRMIIYGNHGLRASVAAMQDVFARILADGGVHKINNDIASVEEIFRLQRMDKMKDDEKTYLR